MRDLAGSLAKGLTIIFDTEVTRIAGQSESWCLHAGNKNFGPFAHVVVTAPAPQTIALVQDCAPDLANALRTVRYEPCMTTMVAFDRRLDLPNCLRSEESPIAWAARNSAKPGRDAQRENWVLQASGDWSAAHLETPPDVIAATLLGLFSREHDLGRAVPTHFAGHRWRYARVTRPLGQPSLAAHAQTLSVAGDGCLGARLECAFDSGCDAARRIIATEA